MMPGARTNQPKPSQPRPSRFGLYVTDEQLEYLAEFGWILASLLHDLGTPLSAALINMDILCKESPGSLATQARKDLIRLEDYILAARRQLQRTDCQISFSPTVAIHETVALLRNKAQANHVILKIKTDGRIRIFGDPIKFRRILSNLIANAIAAYDKSCPWPRVVFIQLVASTQASVKLIVHDNGMGIDKEDLPHVFEPFYRADYNKSTSLGLGLANVKHFIEQDFSGTIEVISDQSGTSFILSIPVGSVKDPSKNSSAIKSV